MVELDPAGQARQVNAEAEAEGALLLLLLSMGEKNPTGQPLLLLPTADSNDDEAWKGGKERKGKKRNQIRSVRT